MKKIVVVLALLLSVIHTQGQIHINPQFGLNFQSLNNLPTGFDYIGKVGVSFGADLRIGDKFQIVPGLHYLTSVNSFSGLGITSTGDITTNYLKIKLLGNFNLLNSKALKLRLNFGPSYDFLVSDADPAFSNINNGEFYLQGGIGVDLLFITADLGYAQSLTDKFTNPLFNGTRTQGMYLSVGIVL